MKAFQYKDNETESKLREALVYVERSKEAVAAK